MPVSSARQNRSRHFDTADRPSTSARFVALV
jgi:hypothetical protein